ncbi:MAG TPA: tRNA pseudouridine(13) synthase TruD [Alphaproteobacteria bacterium]|nr:tRNA pseudouridine(13) synthase TruD [Alphaproteobacteria bacterium]
MIIKHVPEDFIVEEIPLKEWNDDGQFSVYKLVKINMNTEHAISIISKKFNIPSSLIKYSGTKDRHAKTTQYISIPGKTINSSYANPDRIKIEEENLMLHHVGFSDEPLSLGTLKGNKFVITVRELSDKEISALKHKQSRLNSGKEKFMMPNYFDDQRFSSNNFEIGMNIIKGNYKHAVELICSGSESFSESSNEYMQNHANDYIGAIKQLPGKILMLFIHSVQSYLFNEALHDKIIDNRDVKNLKSYEIDYSLGKLVYYNDIKQYESLESELDLPGFDTHTMNHHLKKHVERLGLTSRSFIIRALPNLSVEGTKRECFAQLENLNIEILDDRAIIEFELPKGSYATIAIKGLVND